MPDVLVPAGDPSPGEAKDLDFQASPGCKQDTQNANANNKPRKAQLLDVL